MLQCVGRGLFIKMTKERAIVDVADWSNETPVQDVWGVRIFCPAIVLYGWQSGAGSLLTLRMASGEIIGAEQADQESMRHHERRHILWR